MANWTGTYASGTHTETGTLTGVTSTTATDSGAVWPTAGNSMANRWIKFTSGAASGQYTQIVSNTATVITVTAWSGATPGIGDTYDMVLRFGNNDHITGNVVINGSYPDIIDNGTVLVDGNFSVTAWTLRISKTESTLATMCANTRTVTGKNQFWSSIILNGTVAPAATFLKIQDNVGIGYTLAAGQGDLSGLNRLWFECCSGGPLANSGALAADIVHANMVMRNGTGELVYFRNSASAFKHRYQQCWASGQYGTAFFAWNPGPTLSWMTNCVSIDAGGILGTSNVATGKEHRMSDNYMRRMSFELYFGQSTAAGAVGTYAAFNNVFKGSNIIAGSAGGTPGGAVLKSRNNDYICGYTAPNPGTVFAINIAASTGYTTSGSAFDYIAGQNGACIENVDTTNATSSSASPVQYQNLTGVRTSAQSTKNFILTVDNVVAGAVTSSSQVLTFDCANGSVAGQKTTTNGTSASGQAVLTVTATTMLLVGMTIEIDVPTNTATYETGRILSISAGVSVTLESNLAFTHLTAVTVAPALRNSALPLVRYGTASGVYTMESFMPPSADWDLIWTGIRTSSFGNATSFKRTGHSVTLANLKAGTTYYYRCYAVTPLGDVCDQGAEGTFTTSAAAVATTGYAFTG